MESLYGITYQVEYVGVNILSRKKRGPPYWWDV
jgi:hypothetical protein